MLFGCTSAARCRTRRCLGWPRAKQFAPRLDGSE